MFYPKRYTTRLFLLLPCVFLFFYINGFSQSPGAYSGSRHQGNQGGYISSRNKETTLDDAVNTETKWMKKRLKLTKEQSEKVKEINTRYAYSEQDYKSAIVQIRANALQTADKNRPTHSEDSNLKKLEEKLDNLKKQKDDELKAIFTEEQFAKYMDKKTELEAELRSSSNTGRRPPAPQGF
jgi:hypothetical protein